MRRVRTTGQFRKDLKKSVKRGKKIEKLTEIIESLQQGKILSLAQKDHALKGYWIGCRECHIEPDWLLVYRLEENDLVLVGTGTHTDLFD